MTRFLNSKSVTLAASVAALFIGSVSADVVIMNDGTRLEGEVISETEEKVVIQVNIGGIRDEKHILTADIKGVVILSEEEKLWKESMVQLPIADLQPSSVYAGLIDDRLEPFLAKFPRGQFSTEAETQLETLKKEKELVDKGGVKVDGLWLTAENYSQRKYWIDAEKELIDMRADAASGKVVRALRAFDKLETQYSDSGAYSEAISDVVPVLERYDRELGVAISRSVSLDERISAATRGLTGTEKDLSERQIRRKAERSEKRTKAEMDQRMKWLTPSEYDRELLGRIRTTVREEMDRVVALNPAVIEQRAELLQRIEKTLYEGRIDTAMSLKKKHEDTLEGAKYLEQIDALAAKLKAEKESREAAEVVINVEETAEAAAAAEAAEKVRLAEEEERVAAEKRSTSFANMGDDEEESDEDGGISMVAIGGIVLVLVLIGAVVSNIRNKKQERE